MLLLVVGFLVVVVVVVAVTIEAELGNHRDLLVAFGILVHCSTLSECFVI